MAERRVPVTLLTGFLGSGKTTLLNAVLSDASSGPIAVIVNEFGDVGLDHDLIAEVSDEVLLMQSGCLCCSIRGDLAQTMTDLLERRTAGELAFERVLIETTGLANAGPILHTLLVNPVLAENTQMDGVVTVADAIHVCATLDAQVEAVSQVALADLIVLSKTDLATAKQIAAAQYRLQSLNPNARILHAVKGRGVTNQLWGLSALRPDALRKDVLEWVTDEDVHDHDDHHDHDHGHNHSNHDRQIKTASVILEKPIKDEVYDLWLDTLVALRGPDILRVKGIIFLEGIEAPFVFHGVQHIFDPPVQLERWPHRDRRSRIVVIARDLSHQELQRSFDMLRGQRMRLAPDDATKEEPA